MRYRAFFFGTEIKGVHTGWRVVEVTKMGRKWVHVNVPHMHKRGKIRLADWKDMNAKEIHDD